MSNLTSKELDAVQDQLTMEKLMIQKYKIYSQTATDPQIKSKCEQIAAKHQEHYDKLMNQLNQKIERKNF